MIQLKKVLEIDHKDRAVFEVSQKLSCERNGDSSNGYYEWKVVEDAKGKTDGRGWINDHEAKLLNDYAKKHGAAGGETILIHHWW